jgi:hypothetical protein
MAENPVPNEPLTVELGETGLRGATPREGWLHQEFLAKLRGKQGIRIYREMAENDPLIGAVLNAFHMLIQSLSWTLTAAEESQEAYAVKKGFEDALFRDPVHPFGVVIEEALEMLTYGFALQEIVLRPVREDEALPEVTLKKLAPRAADTVWRWYFDKTGNTLGFDQQLQYGHVVPIPITKCLHFKTRSRLGNPEGKSLLRNAYTSYVKKGVIEDAEGKIATRSAGIVVMRIPQKYLDPKATDEEKRIRQLYERVGNNIARDRQGFLMLSSRKTEQGAYEYDIEYKTTDSGSRPVDHSAIINRHDQRIAMSMMADFIMLGHGKVGSYALSENKTDLFTTAVGAVADSIAEPINSTLIPLLGKMNGIPRELWPKLTHSDLKMQDPMVMANIASTLGASGFTNVLTPEIAAEILRTAKLPVPSDQSDEG